MNEFPFANIVMFFVLILGWLIFAAVFLTRKKPPQAAESKRDRASISGIVLQGVAYALIWSVRRPIFSPIIHLGWPFDIAAVAITIALVACSIWMVITAVRTLGKQWSLTARLVEGHALITEGPYRLVRHPIYTGMFGMMLATGLVMTYWFILLAAIIIFWLARTFVSAAKRDCSAMKSAWSTKIMRGGYRR